MNDLLSAHILMILVVKPNFKYLNFDDYWVFIQTKRENMIIPKKMFKFKNETFLKLYISIFSWYQNYKKQ
jgi:hypothetical protein